MIGFVLGIVPGAMTGSEIGAFAGAVLGMLVGVTVHGYTWARDRLGDAPTVEHHRVMCTPLGSMADVELAGDVKRGRWYDVKRCSLLRPATEVDCDKGCVRRINHAGVRPGRPCACHAETA